MYILQIWIIFIFTVPEYVKCGDNPNNTNGSIENSGGEDDNFYVTETAIDEQKQDDGVQPSTEASEEEEIDVELSEPEEQPYPLGPPQPTHQPFTIEEEQTEPLDLSMKPTQPQQGQPIQTQQIYPQFSQPVHPPQPIQPGYLVRPVTTYPRPPIQPQQLPYPGPQFQVQQQPTPTQPIYPRPPMPVLRPIPRYPQVPYQGHYYPRYSPYPTYQRYIPPTPPTHYVPPPQEPIQRPSIPYIDLPPRHQTPPTHYVPQPQPIEGPTPVAPTIPSETQKSGFEKKTPGRCKSIVLMKRNGRGELIPMIRKDVKKVSYDRNKVKYELLANLEQLYCDGDLVYEHFFWNPYASIIIQNKRNKEFFVKRGDELVIVKHVNNKWKVSDHNIPYCFQLFTKDGEGNDVIITKDQYEVDFSYTECFKYTFISGIRCHKVIVKNKFVWEKKEDEDSYPTAMVLTKVGKVLLFFKGQIVTFIEKYDCYEQIQARTKGRRSKK
ncbi:SVSP family protein [Theileria parva strain Muguga]|uniref:Theileria-specific sub-telomeric protein, SVSP family member n=1 Tax=Theileria parva TaxID=5875 RepID=Q4N0V5_THEPA|nr:SVSP family protein [Theileria parva strain Muguga]EAN30738.1 SVSP family protein [Theileria parva strain Muguga]|eukprot:XP_763021.1 hypothetical protein [Theileria parva strain Muguga]